MQKQNIIATLHRLVAGGMLIEMYGESQFMYFQVDIIIVLYIYGTSHIGEWHLNSMNNAEVINVSLSVSSNEIDYSLVLVSLIRNYTHQIYIRQ